MSRFRSLLKTQAFASGVAQPYREMRHVHVTKRPFVLAYVQMSSEPFSLWACRYGRGVTSTGYIVVPEPRNHEDQNAAFAAFAEVLLKDVRAALADDLEPLQLWVSNGGAAANLKRLGRVMRARHISDEVSYAGAVLDVYAQSADAPGSALCISATEALSRHRATGQSDFEDANLASQLVWWDRALLARISPAVSVPMAVAMSTFTAAGEAEKMAMGTQTTPTVDTRLLEPEIMKLSAARRNSAPVDEIEQGLADLLHDQVTPIWNAIWCAHEQLLTLSETGSADDRWASDSTMFRRQIEWLDGGNHRRFVDSPLQAARLLSGWEASHTDTLRQATIEDDLAFVEAVSDGKAVIGTVSKVDVRKVGGTKHPFVSLDVQAVTLTVGTEVWWRANDEISGTVRSIAEAADGATMEIEVTGGVRKYKNAMPAVGQIVGFHALPPPFPRRPRMPKQLPWTHARRVDDTLDLDDGGVSDAN